MKKISSQFIIKCKYYTRQYYFENEYTLWKCKPTQKKYLKSRSDDACQLGMFTLQSFQTPNMVDLLHTVLENQTKQKNLTSFAKAAYYYQCVALSAIEVADSKNKLSQ